MDWHPNESEFLGWVNRNKGELGVDCIGQTDCWYRTVAGEYHFTDLKTQDAFTPPPFYGHGLPRWQIAKYLRMQVELGVIYHIVVLDKGNFFGYWQRLSVLEDGPFHDTRGSQPRRVYPIDSFEIWTKDWRVSLRKQEAA